MHSLEGELPESAITAEAVPDCCRFKSLGIVDVMGTSVLIVEGLEPAIPVRSLGAQEVC